MTRFLRIRSLRTLAFRGLLACAAVVPAFIAPPAQASVSVAVQFDDLVQKSKAIGVIVPIEQRSVWEGKFIITYTKVQVEDGIAGNAPTGKEVWVVTRGGTIGNIGQTVEGEPVLRVGRPSVAFMREDIVGDKPVSASGIFVITARAQGVFPLVAPETETDSAETPQLSQAELVTRDVRRAKEMALLPKGKRRLVPSNTVGMLLPPQPRVPAIMRPLARDVLHDKTFDEARSVIVDAWRRLHVER